MASQIMVLTCGNF